MLMPDTCQPAVLQLLPFSPNHAGHSHLHSSSPTILPGARSDALSALTPRKSLPVTSDARWGFPVLAVTRKEKNEAGSDSRQSEGGHDAADGRGGPPCPPAPCRRSRVSSERVTRSRTLADDGTGLSWSLSARARVRVDSITPGHRCAGESAKGLQSREQTTCSVRDMNEHITGRPDSSSPDSGTGSLRNSPGLTSSCADSRGLPKPALVSASGAARVTGKENSDVGEGRYVVSKNGMWRSVTLTPGEMEIKKHRDLLDRVTTAHPAASNRGSKFGQQYHKMNIRDLPRSTTPVNDNDPDKLNMKQVIAFLQSKGKSQADAVVLPRGLKSKVTLALPGTVQHGTLRGSVRKYTASCRSAEILMKPSAHLVAKQSKNPSSPGPAGRGNNMTRSTKLSGKEGKVPEKVSRDNKADSLSAASSIKRQKKPFRLHRFLTMVPTARETVTLSSASFPSADRCPLYSAVPLVPPSSKPSHKERTLCLDLANQSRLQTAPSRHTDSKHQAKVHYRLTARPRPSSLRVEQDLSEAQWKLSADFGDYDAMDRMTAMVDSTENSNAKDTKTIIRLPFVIADSEEEDNDLPSASRHSAASKRSIQHKKASHRNVPREITNELEDSDCAWPADAKEVKELQPLCQVSTTSVKEVQDPHSSSQLSTSSSMLPVPSESSDRLPSVSSADIVGDNLHLPVVGDSVDSRPEVISSDVTHLAETDGLTDVKAKTPVSNTKLKVSISIDNELLKDNVTKQKVPDCVTLSLRKERHRTRENTYMSDIGRNDFFPDISDAERVN